MEYRPLEQKVFYGDTESKISVIQSDRATASEAMGKAEKERLLLESATAEGNAIAQAYGG
jgi:hypothetical protein